MKARDAETAARVTIAASTQLLDLAIAIGDGRETREMAMQCGQAVSLAIVALQHVRPQIRRITGGR